MRSVKRVSSDHCRILRNPWMLLEGYPMYFRSSKVPSTKPDTLKVLTANPRNSKNCAHFSRPPFCWTKFPLFCGTPHSGQQGDGSRQASVSKPLNMFTSVYSVPGTRPQSPGTHCPLSRALSTTAPVTLCY